MKKIVVSLAVILSFVSISVCGQQVSVLKPSQTVLLYADSFEGNVDPVSGEEIIYGGFEMQEDILLPVLPISMWMK